MLAGVFFSMVTASVGQVSAQEQIKSRILVIFDTSGSMQWFVDSNNSTYGDGSWDPWGSRFCCPGIGNSRLFHAKEAVRQMVFATGDIEFALMKFAQNYVSSDDYRDYYTADYYRNNQVEGSNDKIRYTAGGSGSSCWPSFSAYDPAVPGSAANWLCAEFPAAGEDNRGPFLMWMDHHEFHSDGSGAPDTVPAGWSRAEAGTAGPHYEQELRAQGATPIAESMLKAEEYLEVVYAEDYAQDPLRAACRPYSVILLTDGDETCGGSPSAASLSLATLYNGTDMAKDVSIWAIGFAFAGDMGVLDQVAANGGTGYARAATSQAELSGVLYDIVSASLLVEVCNQEDDDCDGLTDEDFRPDRTYCNTGAACTFPHDGQPEEPEDILCVRPSECACDGIDNNCDGVTDEPPDGLASWPVIENSCGGCDPTVPGQEYCVDPNEGRCEQGDLVCAPGEGMVCVGSVDPREETCNGLDDDCDGETDEGVGEACGPCGDGNWYCVDGRQQCCGEGTTSDNCVAITMPAVEVCNGIDDDCDGATDEDLTRVCGGCDASLPGLEYCEDPNEGICAEGVSVCVDGVWGACEGDQGPSEEICNAQDDDCDGLTDEGIVGESCGICGDGNWHCIAGAEQCCAGVDADGACIPVRIPAFEICNNIDDDCDGQTDENVAPRECMDPEYEHLAGVGICNKGYQICVEGEWGNDNPDTGAWEAGYCHGQQLPKPETCNLLDDDCDGQTDEDIVGETGCGPCGDGEEQCVNGILQCTGARSPQPEVCNGLDDDCDGYTDENLSRTCMDEAYAHLDGIGICHSGIEICKDGEWGYGETMDSWVAGVCGNQQLPVPEQCDCLDNDCDGEIDEQEDMGAPVGQACNACGVWECRECELVCTGFGEPERCDGLDNNCNGLTDEGIQQSCGGCVEDETTESLDGALLTDCLAAQAANEEIGPGEGECQVGVQFCDPEAADLWGGCQGYISPQRERCDGKDNDCDGVTDEEEDIEHANEVCSTAIGVCEAGWLRCVENDEGGKSLECCREVTEEGRCVPPAGPGVEVCNGLDDDCDGETDEELATTGQPCGLEMGVCRPGTVQCVCDGDGCDLRCVGQIGGSDEVCNGLDDDCDGLTDEDLPLGAECTNAPGGVPTGECDSGFEQCINGEWQCNANKPTEEICDGLDNDCDGFTDEDLAVECPDGSHCIEGVCAPVCYGEELSCMAGMACQPMEIGEGETVRVCITDVCRVGAEDALPCVENPYWCSEGETPLCRCSQEQKKCVSICDGVRCPDGSVCVARTGQCAPIESENCYAAGCPTGEVCRGGECVADPCTDPCPTGEYCNGEGECVRPCIDMDCPSLCFEGECVDRCDGVGCGAEEVCNKVTGECEAVGACARVNCKFYEVCRGGVCIEDPCFGITCPNGLMCQHGSCNEYGVEPRDTDGPSPGDTDVQDSDGTGGGTDSSDTENASANYGMDRVLGTGMGGCLCSSTPGARPAPGGMWLWAAGLLLLAVRVGCRRRRGLAVLLSMSVIAGLLLGCQTEPYQLSSGVLPSSDSDSEEQSGVSDTSSDSETESATCVPQGADDNCDGVDDDCDGETDEDVDFDNNSNHCGACGNDCTGRYPNAFGICVRGECAMGQCAPFYQDINNDASDGCEYFCRKTSDVDRCNGVDLGDGAYVGVDDDCDGETDEDVRLNEDRFNCGRCGNVCVAPHAEPICVDGQCGYSACHEGFVDADGNPDNGCEYRCEATDIEERCNGVDDNCNGQIDEGNPEGGAPCYTLPTGCRETAGDIICEGRCAPGIETCENGVLVCVGQVGPLPVETCNNIDDNCDGQTDERLVRICRKDGAEYEETGACLQGTQRCEAGEWGACVGETLPTEERCDGIDNDCDGETDEDPVDVGLPCGGSPNSADPEEGACRQGVTVCVGGAIVCEGEITPEREICDGIDNDCDGFTDENITTVCGGCDPEVYDYCESRDQGLCQPGVKYCENGEYGACVATIGPKEEVCDGFDNDCDGTVDVDENGEPITGEACGSCGGIEHCLGGQMACCLHLDEHGACVPPGAPTGEVCNGIDDDCDGVIDNNLVQTLCDGDDADLCPEGVTTCIDGVPGCSDMTDDNEELCDGLDNDCDGLTDEDDPDLVGPVDGLCKESCGDAFLGAQCMGAAGWRCRYDCDAIECDAQGQVVSGETLCNGVDDDCDGLTDENLTSKVEHCGACGNDCWNLVGGAGNVASLACVTGECRINACEDGYWDLDGNPDGELDCEYGPCVREGPEGTVCDGIDNDCDGVIDNGAATIEICDGIDNDCDGETDEASDLTPPDLCNPRCPNPGSHVMECHGAEGWKCNYNCIGEPGGTVSCGADEYTLADVETLCDGLDNNCDGSVDEGFLLWSSPAVVNARCANNGLGGCAESGWVTCNAAGDAFDCCAVQASAGACDAAHIIQQDPVPAIDDESGTIPNGVDDDCDGVVDDGADGCVTAVTISGLVPSSQFDIFAFEASRRGTAEAPCSESAGNPEPWTNVSFEEARQACLRLNSAESGCSYAEPDDNPSICWDLCSAEQWYFSCAYWGDLADTPHIYPYGDAYAGDVCNGVDYGQEEVLGTGQAAGCLAEWGATDVMDLSGNVEEWTLDLRTVGETDLRVIRGGSYKTVASGMTCAFDFFAADETELQMDQLGFRCCRGADPITACENALGKIPNHPYDFNVAGLPEQCSADGWWAAAGNKPAARDSSGDWELGKSTQVGAPGNCLFATKLDSNYDNSDDSYLYSPHVSFAACGGATIGVSWSMWFSNAGDSDDYIRLQVRSSDNGGSSWSSWTTVATITQQNQSWTTYSATAISTVDAGALYQLRFQFHADGWTRGLGAYVDNVRFEVE